MTHSKLGDRAVVIVCGSRDGVPAGVLHGWFDAAMDYYDSEICRVAHVISGGSRGIDAMAHEWACRRLRPSTVVMANWDKHKRGAGPIRNGQMHDILVQLSDSGTRRVLAFPSRDGTESMALIARENFTPIWRCALAGMSFRWSEQP